MLFTIFTATYNRADTLTRLYHSLLAQSIKDFEWIVVDDGSSDGTKFLIDSFCDDKKIKIRYFLQKNQGKHVAINNGVKMAKGELFVNIDSDDYIKPLFLEKLYSYWIEISIAERSKLTGVMTSSCMKVGNKESSVGRDWPKKIIISNYIDIANRLYVVGDKHGFIRTELMRKYPFPFFPSEKFMTEAVVMYKIAQKYGTVFVDERLIVVEYRDDGLSKNIRKVFRDNPKGSVLYRYMMITMDYDFPFKQRIVDQAQYFASLYFSHPKEFSFGTIKKIKCKWLFFASLPLALVMIIHDSTYS